MITYEAETHTYRDGANVIPSVTQVLSAHFGIDSQWYAPGAAERGTRIHEICALYATGARGLRLNAWEEAFADWMFFTGAKPIEIEKMIDGEIRERRYAGRLDLVVNIKGRRVLVDIKTGARADWHRAQIAAYARAVDPHLAMILYLSESGFYRDEYLSASQLAEGIKTFGDALALYKKMREEVTA